LPQLLAVLLSQHYAAYQSGQFASYADALFSDGKIFYAAPCQFARTPPPQDISSGIAKLTGRRYRRSKPRSGIGRSNQ